MRVKRSHPHRASDRQTLLHLQCPPVACHPAGVDFSFLRPLKPTVVFATYWRFAAERQQVFFRRLRNLPPPWSSDPVLQEHKFTNAYRAADRVSQFLIRHVIYEGDPAPPQVFFRVLLFKLFNRIETWELLTRELGEVAFSSYAFDRYDEILTNALASGRRLYSAAYIMPSGGRNPAYPRKHQMHLRLLEHMMRDEMPKRISDSRSMAAVFSVLRSYPSIGDFLAYQYVTDLNYSQLTEFSEMEFVAPGPGARDGIRKCFSDFGGLNEAEIIKFIADRQEECFTAVNVQFPTLWGRRLQLIDCQNLFCEVDKYARIVHPGFSGLSGRTRIKQRLRPSSKPLFPWFPPKWGINERIHQPPEYVQRH
jgi:alpha-glutamyl/putrescinyl thymine pyrophosphorylase clade 1